MAPAESNDSKGQPQCWAHGMRMATYIGCLFFLFVALKEIRSMKVHIQQSYNKLSLTYAELYKLFEYIC